jgi:hypothetical protein
MDDGGEEGNGPLVLLYESQFRKIFPPSDKNVLLMEEIRTGGE